MKKGQRIKAQVVEIQPDQQIVVAVEGHLLRVTNRTQRKFNVDETIMLVVAAESPLELKIENPGQGFERMV